MVWREISYVDLFSPACHNSISKKRLTIEVSALVSLIIMQVNKPTVAYKLVQLCSKNPKRQPWHIIIRVFLKGRAAAVGKEQWRNGRFSVN